MVKEFKMAEKRDFLAENNLSMYYDRFLSNGHDDMNQLLNTASSEHVELCKGLGFFHMIGHRK